jgi:hypothetical protein
VLDRKIWNHSTSGESLVSQRLEKGDQRLSVDARLNLRPIALNATRLREILKLVAQ